MFTAPDGLSICEECVEFLSQGLTAQRELEAEQPQDLGPASEMSATFSSLTCQLDLLVHCQSSNAG